MRKTAICLLTAALVLLALCSCAKKADEKQLLSFTAHAGDTVPYMASEPMNSDSGQLYLQNRSSAAIVWYLYGTDNMDVPAYEMTVEPSGAGSFVSLDAKTDYYSAIAASVTQDTEIIVVVSQQPNSDPYTLAGE